MLGNILGSRLVTAAVSCAALALSSASAEELCSVVPYSFTVAKSTYPDLSTALGTLENNAVASWFTDRSTTEERAGLLSRMLSQCPESSRLSIVVYGIPQKDCAGGFSTGGSVTDTNSYKTFLKQLTDTIGDRKVLYVVEPDAVGLLTQDNGCGAAAGYLENLKVAVAALSVNPNAELYLDVGYWMLAYPNSAAKVANAMTDIGNSGRVKGITINTSNYRSNDECAGYCTNFQNAMGSTAMTCIVDTSRNYNGSPTNDWCNIPTAGIGKPPTSNTGYSNLDYFMWIKPPGESDGNCWGGPAAGSFFYGGFKLLWDQGYYVKELGMPKIGETSGTIVTSAPSTSPPTTTSTMAPTFDPSTNAPVATDTQAPTTSTPVIVTPSPVWFTTFPETVAPGTVAPASFTPGTVAPWSFAPSPCRVRKRLRSL
ncbi:hypothetical protein PInf_022358 [Phytophthora infestans]|nr:hypothetical protein PInf_022358 [Phytophthora infestans]